MDLGCNADELLDLEESTLLHNRDVEDICTNLGSIDMSQDLFAIRYDEVNNNVTVSDSGKNCQDADEIVNQRCRDIIDRLEIEVIYTQDRDGDNLLHIAIICYNLLSIIIIEKAATPRWISFANKLFQTPLHLAVLTRQDAIVKKLLTSGADVMARDKDGHTPFHIACRDGLYEIAREFMATIRNRERVHSLDNYEFMNENMLQSLYQVLNYEGYTCLHLAATNRHLKIISLLMENSIDVNMKECKTGRSILHNACLSGDIKLVRVLLKHRPCNINARAYDGLTPFDLARAREHDEVCLVLAAAGARYGTDEIDSD